MFKEWSEIFTKFGEVKKYAVGEDINVGDGFGWVLSGNFITFFVVFSICFG
jgi:hypothetical protein